MGTILIVANQTVGGPELSRAVTVRRDAGADSFFLLVPQPPPPSVAVAAGLAAVESVAYAATVSTLHDELRMVAETRLRHGVDWLRSFGVEADGETGPADALVSVDDLVERLEIDEIIVSTLPSRISKWLRQDLPSRIKRRVGETPIEVVTAADVPADQPDDIRILIGAEERLLERGYRADAEQVASILHPDFVEIGKSAQVFTKDGILAELANDPGATVDASGYEVSFLSDDVALVTYGITGEPRSLRSSIWVREQGRWLLRFHQGTPVADAE